MRGGQVLLMAVTLLALPAGAVGREAARYGQVILPGGTVLDVELAESPARRQRGYMFRDGVGPEDGMIFLFEEEEFHSFWMKNVSFPLDILWMAGDGTVVDVSLLTPPCVEDPCPSYLPQGRALFVLELAGGRAEQLGIHPGQTLQVLIPEAAGAGRP